MRKLVLFFLAAITSSAFADFNIQLDAGKLRQSAAQAMSPGSLLLIVAAGADDTFSPALTSGSYVSGDDAILAAAAFNNSGGTDETLNFITASTQNLPVGTEIALLWFPQITLAQFQSGATPTLGDDYGIYNPKFWGNSTDNPDGQSLWQIPPSGAINLNFFTLDSNGGGTQNPLEGYASFIVVPEPSSLALLGAGLLFGGGYLCRRRRA